MNMLNLFRKQAGMEILGTVKNSDTVYDRQKRGNLLSWQGTEQRGGRNWMNFFICKPAVKIVVMLFLLKSTEQTEAEIYLFWLDILP